MTPNPEDKGLEPTGPEPRDVEPSGTDLTPEQRSALYWKGVLASSLVALFSGVFLPRLFLTLSAWAGNGPSEAVAFLGYTTFLGVPLAMGIVASWAWQPLKLAPKKIFGHSLVLTLFGLVIAGVLFREGVICLIMASLLIAFLVYCGYWLGHWMFEINSRPLYSSLIPLAVVMVWADVTRDKGLSLVQDTIVIRATPGQIWPLLLNTPPIPTKSTYWLTRLGLPEIVRTETAGSGLGTERISRLSQGEVVREKVTRWEPGSHLAVTITQQPKHPEIAGHLDLVNGTLDLHENGDGTTTLVSSMWYHLHVQPLAYFRLFANNAIRNTHWRMLEHVKTIAEAKSTAK